jgi:arrestin-related trafficking adapter 3/6
VLERVDYYVNMSRVSHSEPPKEIVLLSIKFPSKDREGDPILPLTVPLEKSPLYAVVNPGDDVSQMTADFMGPGPWCFHRDLRLPSSCSQLHFTNLNRASNIAIAHILKITFRVQRGDEKGVDPKTGKMKLYDIVAERPVHILSVSFSWVPISCCMSFSYLVPWKYHSAGVIGNGQFFRSILNGLRVIIQARNLVRAR